VATSLDLNTNFFRIKMACNFSKINVTPEEKVFTFYSGLLLQHSLEMSRGCMPSAPPNSQLIKLKEAYWYYFSVFVLVFPSLLENFLLTPLARRMPLVREICGYICIGKTHRNSDLFESSARQY